MRRGTGIHQSETSAYWFGASSIAYVVFIMIIYMYNAITKRCGA
jgi:hypothetical protein